MLSCFFFQLLHFQFEDAKTSEVTPDHHIFEEVIEKHQPPFSVVGDLDSAAGYKDTFQYLDIVWGRLVVYTRNVHISLSIHPSFDLVYDDSVSILNLDNAAIPSCSRRIPSHSVIAVAPRTFS